MELPHAPGLDLRIHTNSELVCCVDRDPVAKTAGCVPGTHPSNSQSIPATCSYALLNQCPMSHTQGILAFRATHPTVLGDGPLSLQHTRSNLARSRETGQVCNLATWNPSHISTKLVNPRESDASAHPIRNAPAHTRCGAAEPRRIALHAYPVLHPTHGPPAAQPHPRPQIPTVTP